MGANPSYPADEIGKRWPYRTMLIYGHFGEYDSGGHEFTPRPSRPLVLMLLALAGAFAIREVVPGVEHLFTGILAAGFGYVFVKGFHYMRALDELNRLIYLEGMAFAYCVTMAIVVPLGWAAIQYHFSVSPALVLCAEFLRGPGMVLAARRYS
ncbi:MAG: hypothetical protein O2968_02480 [Acidobacteria bacterium]|nr:hypothetical protein [Acidobacteriota bacterium]